MQRFQLPGPEYCALAIVASAVAGGGNSVDYLHLHNRRTLNLNGLGFDFSQCHEALASDNQIASLNYLMLAWDGQSGALLQNTAGRWQATPLLEPPWEDRQARTRTVRGLIGLSGEVDSIADVLKAYCCYSPVPVRVGARELTLTHQARWRVVAVVNTQRLPRVLKPLSVQSQLELEVDAPFCGYLGYGPGGGGLLVVVDGLLWCLRSWAKATARSPSLRCRGNCGTGQSGRSSPLESPMGGRPQIHNPHQLGFRDLPIMGLCGGIRFLVWPQVHLRPASVTYTTDGLVWLRYQQRTAVSQSRSGFGAG